MRSTKAILFALALFAGAAFVVSGQTFTPSRTSSPTLATNDGTAAAPAVMFGSETTSGRYRVGSNDIGEAIAGTRVFDWDASRLKFAALYATRWYANATDFVQVVSSSTANTLFTQTEPTPGAPSAALAGAGAGNVDNGTHVYAVTCVTAAGQTSASAASSSVNVVDKTMNGKVTVTLGTSCTKFTTGRNIYRSKTGTTTPLFLVAASPVVADNTTATYLDNIADASLQAGTAPTANTTSNATGTLTPAGVFTPGTTSSLTHANPANQTGNATATFKMNGLGAAAAPCTITPTVSGRVIFLITGNQVQSTTADGVTFKLTYGTGAAPANAAAATGTVASATQAWTGLTGQLQTGFAIQSMATGLALGTAVWYDLQIADVTGGTASVTNIDCTAEEM